VLPDPRTARCALCVQPHYDDNDLGAGGTFAALARAGCEVHYLTVTDDLLGVLDASLDDTQSRRTLRAEQQRAGSEIGVSSQTWLDHPDAGDWSEIAVRGQLVEQIRRLRPDWIFSVDPWLPYEAHPDHLKVARAVLQAAMFYRLPRCKTRPEIDDAYEPHDLAGIGLYFTRDANCVVDIGETREAKHRAIAAYRAQFSDDDLTALGRGLEAMEQRWARDEPFSHGEALRVLRPGQLHVNLLPD
jgi:LmbE family N-acetylglucosaminyl deacetylase